MSFPVGPNGEAVYFSSREPSQATVTVASSLPVPGALYRVVAYNPNGVASNPVTFTITNSLQAPAFLNPGPKTFVGGGLFVLPRMVFFQFLGFELLPLQWERQLVQTCWACGHSHMIWASVVVFPQPSGQLLDPMAWVLSLSVWYLNANHTR
jgi:hypothetical protein